MRIIYKFDCFTGCPSKAFVFLLHGSITSSLEDLHDADNLITDLYDIIRAAQVDDLTTDLK
jgi:hypothetical protein